MAIKAEELDQYVKLAAEGNKASFEELYRQTYGTVYFTCLSFLKNEQDAADMTHEVYVTVLGSLSILEDHSKFLPWLNKIAVNKCKDRLKAAKAIPMDMEEENQPVEENENFLPEEYITNQAKRRIVMDIMKNRLTEAQYQTVIMFYFNEFTAQEISEIMECPIGTVTYRLSAAREKIRQGVSEYENKNHDKLYSYAAAVPLLAGVLTAESLNLNVQAAAADAASITNAAPINKAANTSKGGTIKNMLKTPKTMIAAAAAAIVIIGGITAAVIATNHEDSPSSNSQTRQEGQQASYDTDEVAFWLHTADWGEEKDLTGITLFNGECTAPIRLEDFDGDERLAPYCGSLGYFAHAYSYNLTELFDTDETGGHAAYSDYDTHFLVQHMYDENDQSVYLGSEDPSAIADIILYNFTGEDLSIRQIYENNWFCITASQEFLMEFGANELGNAPEGDSTIMLNAMIDKYGRPSYIMGRDSLLDDIKNDDWPTTTYYLLVWEKEDFVLTMLVYEFIFSNTNYSMKLNDSDHFAYITRELWDDYKEHEYLQEGFVIYELDDLK